MKLQFAVLADYVANAGGKLFICGTFDVFQVAQVPVVLPVAGLGIKIEASHGEIGRHKLTINLRDEDGKAIVPRIDGEVQLAEGPLVKGAPPALQAALNFSGLRFEKAGTYEFEILLDGHHLGSVPFHVVKIGEAKQAA
jgi:uncharacterized protein DUF6941